MRVILVLALGAWMAGVATAQSDADRTAVQTAIDQQLRAFLRDDGATAYSYAAPGIKQLFPSAEIFMDMVRKLYPQVYRPRSYAFGELSERSGQLVQDVEIVDAAGVAWTATYTLKLVDGMWQITGCYLEKNPATMV